MSDLYPDLALIVFNMSPEITLQLGNSMVENLQHLALAVEHTEEDRKLAVDDIFASKHAQRCEEGRVSEV